MFNSQCSSDRMGIENLELNIDRIPFPIFLIEREHFMRLQGLLGIFVFIGIAWLISEKRKAVRASTIAAGVVVQFAVAGCCFMFLFLRSSFCF